MRNPPQRPNRVARSVWMILYSHTLATEATQMRLAAGPVGPGLLANWATKA
jgi:hypothetical protein